MRLPNSGAALMGLLDGGGAALMHAVFSGIYLDADLYRPTIFTDDGAGGGDDPAVGDPEAVKIQLEAATEAMRAAEGFTQLDVRILMLAHGVERPDTNCTIDYEGAHYAIIGPVGRDPAGAYWDIHGRPTNAPAAS